MFKNQRLLLVLPILFEFHPYQMSSLYLWPFIGIAPNSLHYAWISKLFGLKNRCSKIWPLHGNAIFTSTNYGIRRFNSLCTDALKRTNPLLPTINPITKSIGAILIPWLFRVGISHIIMFRWDGRQNWKVRNGGPEYSKSGRHQVLWLEGSRSLRFYDRECWVWEIFSTIHTWFIYECDFKTFLTKEWFPYCLLTSSLFRQFHDMHVTRSIFYRDILQGEIDSCFFQIKTGNLWILFRVDNH